MKKPETGGRFARDPKTKKLSQVEKPTTEAPKPTAATVSKPDTVEEGK
ncbi:hypothetical protein [Oceaniglobus trochenteri]|nr:hypothetical protein [Oceaniglobus trochenteri]